MKKEDIKKMVEKAKNSAPVKITNEWFVDLLVSSVELAFKKNTPKFYREKYPNLDNDGIVKKIVTTASGYTSIVGGATGVGGITTAVPLLAADLAVSTKLNIQMVVDIARLYNPELDVKNDPEEMLKLAFTALGSKVIPKVATDGSIKLGSKVIGKIVMDQSLKNSGAVQRALYTALYKTFGKKAAESIFKKSVSKTVAKAVPIIGAGAGAAINFGMTQSVGRLALKHYKN